MPGAPPTSKSWWRHSGRCRDRGMGGVIFKSKDAQVAAITSNDPTLGWGLEASCLPTGRSLTSRICRKQTRRGAVARFVRCPLSGFSAESTDAETCAARSVQARNRLCTAQHRGILFRCMILRISGRLFRWGAGSESDSQCKRPCLTVHDLRPGPRNRGPARIGEAPCHSQHGAHPPGYSMGLPTSLCSAVRRAITCQHFRRRKGPSGDNPHNRKTLNSGSRFVSSETSDCEPAPAQFDYWPVAGALA